MKNMKQVESKASNEVRLQIYSQTYYQAWHQVQMLVRYQIDRQIWGMAKKQIWHSVSVLTEMKKFVR
jgi:hypothetical protein